MRRILILSLALLALAAPAAMARPAQDPPAPVQHSIPVADDGTDWTRSASSAASS